jgi:cell division protein FtsQ
MFKRWIENIKNVFGKVRGWLIPAIFVFLLFFFVSFANKSHDQVKCVDVKVRLFPDDENFFLNEKDVMEDIEKTHGSQVFNQEFQDLNMYKFEEELNKNQFIENSEVYNDLVGNLYVDVYHRKPVLRIIDRFGNSYYIDKKGNVMPLSKKYTSKILVATGYISDSDSILKKDLYNLAYKIKSDKFLHALIGQVDVNKKRELVMIPKIGDYIIEFGTFEDVDIKFKKLKLAYKKVLPAKGWNKYDRIVLKYNGQIILKKK